MPGGGGFGFEQSCMRVCLDKTKTHNTSTTQDLTLKVLKVEDSICCSLLRCPTQKKHTHGTNCLSIVSRRWTHWMSNLQRELARPSEFLMNFGKTRQNREGLGKVWMIRAEQTCCNFESMFNALRARVTGLIVCGWSVSQSNSDSGHLITVWSQQLKTDHRDWSQMDNKKLEIAIGRGVFGLCSRVCCVTGRRPIILVIGVIKMNWPQTDQRRITPTPHWSNWVTN